MSHFSNIARFLGLASPDLLVLQSFMVVASSTNALYNLLQPKPLYVPCTYGAVFTLLSASIVARIASERLSSSGNLGRRDRAEKKASCFLVGRADVRSQTSGASPLVAQG